VSQKLEKKKYIVIWTWREEDTENGIKLALEIDELRKETPDDYPSSLGSSYLTSPLGFTLFEANEVQIKNWLEHYKSVLIVLKIMPIKSAREFIEQYRKEKL
jgi:intein-encoded DNA endonuclease-like protein